MSVFKIAGGGVLALFLGVHGAQAQTPESLPKVGNSFIARPLPLAAVRLTGGPLKRAQDVDAAYLLQLEPDRMLAYFRVRAGLAPKAKGYDGWDGDGHNLTGHLAGHYLSAVSLMYAATGDERFKQRADYLVSQFKEIQNPNGYLGALENGPQHFAEIARGDIRSTSFDLNGMWSPWYVLHKTFAGLRDAYRNTGNRDALLVEVKFALWVENLMLGLTDAQTQQMLNTEFGGMNEVLVDLYVDTGARRFLDLAHHFEHRAVLNPLKIGQDKLDGLHANTQVPKLLGTLASFVATDNPVDGRAANFFWDSVVAHHSFATGGHGKDEYFGAPDVLSAQIDGRTDESCNVYNMLKMTRTLFALRPDVKYADYEERALFNHVLGSIDPVSGQMCYMVPVGRGVTREYQDMFGSFTCCVGSGMENHALSGDGIYYEGTDPSGTPCLWVNLYAPSTAQWKTADASVVMSTDFPEGESAMLKITTAKSQNLTLLLRRPAWAGAGFEVKVNGKTVGTEAKPDSYIELKRKWKSGDTVSLSLPKALHAEPLADNPNRVALLWGPLVLAGDLGPEGDVTAPPAPVFVAAGQPPAQWLRPVAGKTGAFQSVDVGHDTNDGGRAETVRFEPFYRLHHRTYSAYFDLYTPQEWTVQSARLAAEAEKKRKLEAATVAFVQPGEMQSERDFHQQGERTQLTRAMGRRGRRGSSWFSFDIPIDPTHPTTLVATYHSDEGRPRTFDLLVDGQKVADQSIKPQLPGYFFDVEYPLPAALLVGKTKITVRFQATGGNEIAALYGLRTIRADAPR